MFCVKVVPLVENKLMVGVFNVSEELEKYTEVKVIWYTRQEIPDTMKIIRGNYNLTLAVY